MVSPLLRDSNRKIINSRIRLRNRLIDYFMHIFYVNIKEDAFTWLIHAKREEEINVGVFSQRAQYLGCFE